MLKFTLFSLGFLFAISPAQARDTNTYVNMEMKRTEAYQQMEIQRAGLTFLKNPDEDLNGLPVSNVESTLNASDRNFDNIDAIRPGEQAGAMDRPRAVFAKHVDPTNVIAEELSERQEYQRYRNNYRRAVQREFQRKAQLEGVEVNRNVAEEIRNLENASVH